MEDYDAVVQRHLKEKKDLGNQVNSIRASMKKSNRKQLLQKIDDLEVQLRLRHAEELGKVSGGYEEVEEVEVTPEMLLQQLSMEETEVGPQVQAQPQVQPQKKKRNRQKERLAKRQQEIGRMQEEARKEASEMPDNQQLEQDLIEEYLQKHGFEQFDIKPDGHCLFASVLDQLSVNGLSTVECDSVAKLRTVACQYIDSNRDDFIPFMFDEVTGEMHDLDQYLKEMETTAKWGGELELLALSKSLGVTINVLINDLASKAVNFQKYNEETAESGSNVYVVYFKHSYTLGEHYNSLRKVSDQ